MPDTARVVPLAPVEGAYTYRVPPEMAAEAVPGARVVIPFGRRTLTGVVAARTDEDRPRLKALRDVLDEAPAFSEPLLKLTRWIADYYVCAWGEVLKAALPAGATVESRRVVRLAEGGGEEGEGRGERAEGGGGSRAGRGGVLEALADGPVPLDVLVGGGVTHHLLRKLEREGVVAIEHALAGPSAQTQTATHLRLVEGGGGDGAEDRGERAEGGGSEGGGGAPHSSTPPLPHSLHGAVRGVKQRAVLEALARMREGGEPEPAQAEVLAATGASSATVKGLVEKGLVERVEREVVRTPYGALPETPPDLALHASQRAALAAIGEAVAARRAQTFLLHGVTGSGKTEVYIQALRQTLEQGRTGIVLVPEIALTPQTVRRFRAHFGDRIAVLHSRMSTGERFDAWRHLQGGRFDVAIGPRSAVFAPLRDVGLIVVDEEHEPSYKQFDPAPRYHARDVAVMRAHLEGAACVLGSATPSLETYLNAKAEKYTLLRMPVRVPVPGHEAAPLPEVRVVDLTWERKVRRLKGALSHPLREAIAARIERGEGVILLQNRRGYSPVLTCADCGHTPHCRDCAVSLTYHQTHRHLRCHYCGRTERLPDPCPACNGGAFERVGVGTQRVEEELAEVFPGVRVLRMDLDTTGRKDAHRTLLDAFGRGDADVLLGTQMVAKGLDFPRVTLVGVVDADTGLLMPDFRAAERTFQLLMQVAGRAGRGGLLGEVLLQTRSPAHPALRCATDHDYLAFLREELPDRRALGYPPYGRMVGVEFKGADEGAVARAAERWTAGLRTLAGPHDVLGPEPAFVGRVKRQFRFHTLLKGGEGTGGAALSRIARAANERFGTPPNGIRVNIDVDPVGLL